MNVAHCPAVILVFAMEGCGACEDYKPRLEREVVRWQGLGWPFVIADDPDRTFSDREIPVVLIDANSQDPQVQELGDGFDVQGLPTTILFRQGAIPEQHVGSIDDAEIYALLRTAVGR